MNEERHEEIMNAISNLSAQFSEMLREFKKRGELLQFEDAATRFAKIEKTIDELLADNPKLTTLDINRILYRQFGTRIHKGNESWSGETIQLRTEVTEQLRQNYLVSRGIHPSSHTAINKNSLPQSIVHSCTT